MYVHQTHRGPRGGRRRVEYFDDLLAAKLDVEDDGAVLRIRTTEGQINLSMDLDELQYLVTAFAHPVDPATLDFVLEVEAPTTSEPATLLPSTALAVEARAPKAQEPQSAWERLLGDDIFARAEVQS